MVLFSDIHVELFCHIIAQFFAKDSPAFHWVGLEVSSFTLPSNRSVCEGIVYFFVVTDQNVRQGLCWRSVTPFVRLGKLPYTHFLETKNAPQRFAVLSIFFSETYSLTSVLKLENEILNLSVQHSILASSELILDIRSLIHSKATFLKKDIRDFDGSSNKSVISDTSDQYIGKVLGSLQYLKTMNHVRIDDDFKSEWAY